MSDVFLEQLVRVKLPSSQRIARILLWIGALLLFVLVTIVALWLSPFTLMIDFVALIGIFFGARALNAFFEIEYEYIVTNECFDIDCILAKSRRKRVLSLDIRSTEDFGVFSPQKPPRVERVVFAGDGVGEAYVLVSRYKGQKIALVFSPNEELLSAVRRYLPRTIEREAFRVNR